MATRDPGVPVAPNEPQLDDRYRVPVVVGYGRVVVYLAAALTAAIAIWALIKGADRDLLSSAAAAALAFVNATLTP